MHLTTRSALSVAVALSLGAPLVLAQGGGGGGGAPPPLLPPPVPPGNALTPEKALLGKALFFEEQLSATRTVACATCHISSVGGSDPRSLSGTPGSTHPGFDELFGTADDVQGSPGVPRNLPNGTYQNTPSFGINAQVTGRKAPSHIMAAYAPRLFWDGRAEGPFEDPLTGAVLIPVGASLEIQAAGPPLSDVEMAHTGAGWVGVAAQIETATPLRLASNIPAALAGFVANRTYPEMFDQVFGSPDVTPARIAMAIATYERTLFPNQAPIDLIQLSPQQQQGMQIFNGQGNCNNCHAGPTFSDNTFRNIGVRPVFEDMGRGAITGQPQDDGRFRVPSLRNVSLRGPYFHNGSADTLMDVVEFYDRGGDFGQNQDPLINPLGLNQQQKNALVAFLQALTDPRVALEQPPFDRPTLYSESNLVPHTYGAGTAGAGGFVPRAIAIEPPYAGNPELTLALDNANGDAAVVLGLDFAADVTGTNVLGVDLHLAGSAQLVLLPPAPLFGQGAGNGRRSMVFSLPDNPALVGVDLFGQWFPLDPGGPQGLSATEGFHLEIF